MTNADSWIRRYVRRASDRVAVLRERAERTLLWQVWDRMLEIEFVDRSVALAGKAFVSLFPLIIVVAAFMPQSIRASIFSTLTHRLGVRGHALVISKQAFASADQIRRATGILGLVLTVFFASSFTTALQRVYLRAWRRPPGRKAGRQYIRGPVWFLALLASMAVLGGLRVLLGNGPLLVVFVILSIAGTTTLWWFTAWYMLQGQVRWRVLLPSAATTAIAMAGYAVSASIWMPNVVTKNESQFGFFGVALALVTWFSGAAIAILVGACAGAVFASDTGRVGTFIRGAESSMFVEGAEPSLAAPESALRLRDAFRAAEDEVGAP